MGEASYIRHMTSFIWRYLVSESNGASVLKVEADKVTPFFYLPFLERYDVEHLFAVVTRIQDKFVVTKSRKNSVRKR